MMEGTRCGRRKQKNPRRKNVENGEDGEEADDTALDKNKNKIVHSPSPSDSYHDSDRDSSNHYGNRDESEAPAEKKITREVPPPKVEKYISPEEKVAAILREIQSATTNATNVSSHKNGGVQSGSHGDTKSRGNKAEEARIAELLNRGDTAVIYPEPVSDGEEQQNNEGRANDEEIVLKCMHCPQTFLRAIVLRDHMREVHADKPLKFMCPKCDETFHQKSQLDKHLTLHSPTSQVCNVCNKTFANVYRLQRHLISHNESTDLRKFKCPECGKAFKFKHHLKEHIRIHSGEKPFVCMNCGKRFSHSGSFSSHTTSKKCWGLSATRSRDGSQSQSPNQTSHTQGASALTSASNFAAKVSASQPSSREDSSTVPTPSSQHIPQLYAQQRGLNPFFYPPQMFTSPDGFLHPMYSGMPHHPAMALPGLTLSSIAAAASKERGHSSHGSHNTSHPSVSSLSSAGRSTRSMSPHSQSTRSFSPHSRSERSMSPGSVFSMSSPPATPSRRSMTPVYQRPDATSTPVRETASTSSTSATRLEQIKPDENSNTELLKEKEASKKDISEDKTQDSTKKTESTTETSKSHVVPTASERRPSSECVSNDKLACQYCQESFESPVTLHQHERYLCKLNKEILQHRAQVDTCQSPHSTVSDISHVESTTNGSLSTMSDDEEVEELYKDVDSSLDEKNMRIRTQFTEDQQQYLRSQYQINPRPRKFELIRMGNKIGFPKRVVQVWFQNMRARERKYGRDAMSAPNFLRQEARDSDFTKSYPYIPNVPKPFNNVTSTPKSSSPQVVTSEVQKTSKTGESPLDLSTRKSPPLAHGGSGSRQSTPESVHDTGALNLSLKKEPSEEREIQKESSSSNEHASTSDIEKSGKDGKNELHDVKKLDGTEAEGRDGDERVESKADDNMSVHSLENNTTDQRGDNKKTSDSEHSDDSERENSDDGRSQEESLRDQVQKSFQDSPIFKYMQQEGMFMNKQFQHLPVTMASNFALMQSQFLQQTMASVLNMPHCQPGVELNIPQTSKSSLLFDTSRHSETAALRPPSAVSMLSTDTSCTSTSTSSATSPAAFSYPGTDHQVSAMARHLSHLSASHSHFSPTGHPSHMEDTHNLTTLAEAAQQAATIQSGKPKRMRKKTWRQVDCYVESEEAQLDLEDSQSTDDESQPSRKKRKSWKGHRVDRDEGMYACDQCNKLFSKQSSLARHKYEHSGARPFACDMCTKSFKHKHHLTEHKRLHSGEKPFQCKKCGKRFSHSGSFSQHMNHRYNYCSPHKTSDGDNDGEMSAQDSP